MAKKSKTVDLKPKADKISDEQLTQLQNLVSNINKIKFDIGTFEAQKHNLLHSLMIANEGIMKLQGDFQEEYGTYDINIQDGTITEREDVEADKED